MVSMYVFGYRFPLCTSLSVILLYYLFSSILSDFPVVPVVPVNITPPPAQIATPQPDEHRSGIHKRLAHIPGLTGSNTSYMIPENIRKKLTDGWYSHVPLTYLTDKHCEFKNKSTLNVSQDILSFDPSSGQVITTSRVLHDNGELELLFDKWHQAWRWLLELIKDHLPQEYPLWEVHYTQIMNSENRSELWPLYLAYDAEIHKRTTQFAIDPSIFSIGIWNDLEVRYSHKKTLSMVWNDLKHHPVMSTLMFCAHSYLFSHFSAFILD